MNRIKWLLIILIMLIRINDDIFCKSYLPLLDDHKRYNVIYGGASSGKSYFCPQRDIIRFVSEPGHNYLILRKVDRTVKFSTFADMKKIIYRWGLQDFVKINKTDQHILCLHNENNMLFKGMDDPEKVKSITFDNGPLTDIRLEEATEFTEEDFKQLKLRMRGEAKVPKQMTLVFNPISALHWAKSIFFDNPLPEDVCTILKTTYLDNEFLTPEDIIEIERFRTEDPMYWKIYGLGEWGIIGNIVFHNFVIEDFNYDEKHLTNVCYGMDFGFNHASTLMSVGFKDDDIYIFDEQYYKKHTNPEFIERVQKSGFDRKGVIFADSAEPDRIKEFKKAGYKIKPAKKGKGSLKMGIDFLRSRRIHIHKTKCPNTAREFQLFKYREDKNNQPLEEFVEIFDDCIAGIRYATEWLWGKGYGRVGKQRLKGLGL